MRRHKQFQRCLTDADINRIVPLCLTEGVQLVDSEAVKKERNRFKNGGRDLKSTLFKYWYYQGMFNDVGFVPEDLNLLKSGYSPIVLREDGIEETLFTIHHIIPLNCGGKTVPTNLIPIPREFHRFLHEKIIDPQLRDKKLGEKFWLRGLPDFNKVTLENMLDKKFMLCYQKYIIDHLNIIPVKITSQDQALKFNKWYRENLEHIRAD